MYYDEKEQLLTMFIISSNVSFKQKFNNVLILNVFVLINKHYLLILKINKYVFDKITEEFIMYMSKILFDKY